MIHLMIVFKAWNALWTINFLDVHSIYFQIYFTSLEQWSIDALFPF